jgi:hypothetical protein
MLFMLSCVGGGGGGGGGCGGREREVRTTGANEEIDRRSSLRLVGRRIYSPFNEPISTMGR